MILFPAIDLFEGRVVRLKQGEFDSQTHYGHKPLDVARRYRDAGCTHLHIVDLEGARTGKPCHLRELEEMTELGFFTQYGGGVRTLEGINRCLDAGASRIMVGSLLFKDANMPKTLHDLFGSGILPSVDVKKGVVVHSGWQESSGLSPLECLEQLNEVGFSSFLVTSVERDGMLLGPDLKLYEGMAKKYGIVAAAGVRNVEDLHALDRLGVKAAIIGKALYEGHFPLDRALKEFPQHR